MFFKFLLKRVVIQQYSYCWRIFKNGYTITILHLTYTKKVIKNVKLVWLGSEWVLQIYNFCFFDVSKSKLQFLNGTACFKNVNNCLNTNIYSNLETSGGQSSTLYLNVVCFFNTSVNVTSVANKDSCFPALVSNMCCSIT